MYTQDTVFKALEHVSVRTRNELLFNYKAIISNVLLKQINDLPNSVNSYERSTALNSFQ